MSTLEEKQKQRFQFLDRVYDTSQGNTMQWMNLWDIGEELGWDRNVTDSVAQYLVGEGLIKFWALGGTLGITHEGIRQVERARSDPQKATDYFPPIINIMSGDLRGSNINIGSTLSQVSQSINASSHTAQTTKEELNALIDHLGKILQQVPQEKIEEAEAVAESAKILVEAATREKPNKTLVSISTEGLKKAAENIAQVLPAALPIAMEIAKKIQLLLP